MGKYNYQKLNINIQTLKKAIIDTVFSKNIYPF